MKQLVIIAGGFHPFHAGHLALYQSALAAFPGADVKVAATNDTSARPFPFKLKEKLAQLAGVPPGDFYQVKSPFQALEITQKYNPADTQLIFVRSEKDADKPPLPGKIKKDGNPGYLQPISDQMAPMTQHAYMAYLPTVEFGPGMTSATQIRTAWPNLNERQRTALVMSLYPDTQKNPKLANTVVRMLDTAMGAEVAEGMQPITELRDRMFQFVKSVLPKWPDYVLKDWIYGLAKGDHQAGVGGWAEDPEWGFNRRTILKMIAENGLSPDTQWQLVPNMKFTLDMFDPKNKQRLIGRAGGHSDLGMGIPRDKERHATQAQLAQQQGGVRKEPVILIKTANGYELLEGWHRTIQHFAKYPDGYTGPAYVAVAQGQQGVAEAFDTPYKTKTEKSEYGDVDVLAKLPDGTNLSIMFNHEGDNEWQVEFYRDNSQEVTGQGDAQRIFATVLAAIQKFVKKYQPDVIKFSAEKSNNSDSRSSLYDRLVSRFAQQLGYNDYSEEYMSSTMYELSKQSQGVDEEVTRQMSQGGLRASYQNKYNQPMMEDYLDEARS